VLKLHQVRKAKQRKAQLFQHIFFHPDYTVGFGVTPNLRSRARGLYRQSGISPCPEDIAIFKCSSRLYRRICSVSIPEACFFIWRPLQNLCGSCMRVYWKTRKREKPV